MLDVIAILAAVGTFASVVHGTDYLYGVVVEGKPVIQACNIIPGSCDPPPVKTTFKRKTRPPQ